MKITQTKLSFAQDRSSLKKFKDEKLEPLARVHDPSDEMVIEDSLKPEHDAFIKSMKKDFDWIYAATEPGGAGIYCFLCQEYVKVHKISLNMLQKKYIEKPSTNLKTSAPRDHEKCFIHREAGKWKYGPQHAKDKENEQTLENFETNRLAIKDDDIICHFLATYFLSKEDMALNKFPALLSLLETCTVDINNNYKNNKMATEFLTCIATKLREDVMMEINSSPYIGLMIDESLDVGMIEHLVVNIRYIHENKVKERFCALIQLHSLDAKSIFDSLNSFLLKYKLHNKIVAISTDGASVMLAQNGVASLLKDYLANKNLIINHCLSHRLNLGAKDLWKNDKTLNNYNSSLHSLCKYFSKSSKRNKILMEEEEEEKLESQLKLLKPIDVRWLSIYTVIERIHQLYPALISALEVINENEDCVIAEGLLSRMKSVHFVSLLHIFRDLLNFLDPLNSIFQDQSLTIDQAFREIDTTIKNLEELASSGSLGDFFWRILSCKSRFRRD